MVSSSAVINALNENSIKSSNPLRDENARLDALMRRDITSPQRGNLAAQFREVIGPYLITDLTSNHFLHIHRAATPYPCSSSLKSFMSISDFMAFLGNEGHALRDHYLNFKARGFTGCVLIAEQATKAMNARARDCATLRTSGDGSHYYTQACVDGRDYRVDFTIDQFLAYPEVIERHRVYATTRRMDPPPSFAGALVMPFREI